MRQVRVIQLLKIQVSMAQTISLAPININMIFEGSSIPFIIVCAFILGTIIGSFLNVVILRHNSGRTVGGRSMCFSCGKTLHWHELVPVFSYLLQRGKCTKCKSKISPQYPVVEFPYVGFPFARAMKWPDQRGFSV